MTDDGKSRLYERIPLLPQLKNYGYNPSTVAENPYTSERINGVCVNYEDHGGVWQFLYPSLIQRLPLRGIAWKNHLQTTKTIDRLHVNFQQILPAGQQTMDNSTGLVYLFVVKCEDMDTYKMKIKPALSAWVDRMTLHKNEWLVLYVPLGTQASTSSTSRGLGAFSQTFRDSSKIYRKIFERMKIDIADKGEKTKMDRICKIDVLEGSSVQGAVPGQQQQHESQWSEVLIKLKTCIMDAFDSRCLEHEEQLRLLDGKRTMDGWDFSSFLQVKESLALLYIQATLFDDAIRHYDELEAIYTSLDSAPDDQTKRLVNDDPIFMSSPFDLDMTSVRMNIAVNSASPVYIRLYLFCRQVAISYLMDAHVDVCTRALAFIPQMRAMLQQQHPLDVALPLQWAVGAALALCVSCEHECGEAPSPALAKYFGDLLYLARQNCKKLLSLPRQKSSQMSWYHTFQSNEVLDELTSLASLQYAKAGRVRFAAFLGGQCAAHARTHGNRDTPVAQLLLAQMQQYEKDQWWELMHATLLELLSTELAAGHVLEVIDLALHWMHLDAAKHTSSKVLSIWLDALKIAAVQNEVVHVIWTHLFESSIQATEVSSTSVQLQLTVKNTLAVDIPVEYIGVEFDKTLAKSSSFDECLSLDSVLAAEGKKLLRSSTSETMDAIDDFTTYLSEDHEMTKSAPPLERSTTLTTTLASCVFRGRCTSTFTLAIDAVDKESLLPTGPYICRRIVCRLGAFEFSLPLEEPATFVVAPPCLSSLDLEVECPPLILPGTSEPLVVVLDPRRDTFLGGQMLIKCHGAGVKLTCPPNIDCKRTDDDESFTVQLAPASKLFRQVFTIVSTTIQGSIDIDVAVAYAFTDGKHPSQRATKRLAVSCVVAPLVQVTTTTKQVAPTLCSIQLDVRCNDRMGIVIHPASYELWVVDKEGMNLLDSEKHHPNLKVVANPNKQLTPMRILPSGTIHAAFLVNVDSAYDRDTTDLKWRFSYSSLVDETTLVFHDVMFPFTLSAVPPQDQFQLVVELDVPATSKVHQRDWVHITVNTTCPAKPVDITPYWICLDDRSQQHWLCAGLATQVLCPKVRFKLLPRHIGRLPHPSFAIRTIQSGSKQQMEALDRSLVRQTPQDAFVLVVS
ncbi:hypothetical protein LEN26_007291 [Aphanomyces euteiches]|nr:hypothetical protein AeMF1_001718 [Aphanomyces euteiches]KAH9132785.1 hypothetical protein LEN26_007291 [Aphanomyces euteiches]KAH9183200.1 hypothetical protein AeNC1_014825 [Aphanomyces euteiches]